MRSKAERRIYNLIKATKPFLPVKSEYHVKVEGRDLFIDLFLPTLSVGIEIQGDQHSQSNHFFHGSDPDVQKISFAKQRERDELKRMLVEEGITILFLDYKEAMKITGEELFERIAQAVRGKYNDHIRDSSEW